MDQIQELHVELYKVIIALSVYIFDEVQEELKISGIKVMNHKSGMKGKKRH